MANWLQHIFLGRCVALPTMVSLLSLTATSASQASTLNIDTEFFEVGASLGMLTVEHFTSEPTIGINTSFRATENFFLQANIFQTEISSTSAEEHSGVGSYSDKRDYKHFNLLIGYRLFQGEIFRNDYSGLSSFYLTGGVGETRFLDEYNFTYVFGMGYQMAMGRHYSLTIDYNMYQYDTVVIDPDKTTVQNSHLSFGFHWLF